MSSHRTGIHPNEPKRKRRHPGCSHRSEIVGSRLFGAFCGGLGGRPFRSSHVTLLGATLTGSSFASTRYLRIAGLCAFSSSQVTVVGGVCPQVISGRTFFAIVTALAFSSGGSRVGGFIRGCNEH